MRVEISMNSGALNAGASTSNCIQLDEPAVNLHTEYISLDSKVNVCVAKYWVIKRGLTAATGLGIGVWITVAFGGVITLLVNPGYDACINMAASMITVGVFLSAISAILYTKVIGYCRRKELGVAQLARQLAMGEGGALAMVALNHLERPMEVMAPLEVIERAKIRSGPHHLGPVVLQYTRGMTLKYGCTGRDGKNATVYLPDPNAPIDKYPYLKTSVIACISFFYVGICIIATFMIIWVSAYPYDHHSLTVCVAMEAMGGSHKGKFLSTCYAIFLSASTPTRLRKRRRNHFVVATSYVTGMMSAGHQQQQPGGELPHCPEPSTLPGRPPTPTPQMF